VGKAVVRNKVRRRIREATRLLLPRLPAGHDLVLIARPASAAAEWRAIQAAVAGVLGRAGLLSAEPNGRGAAACV
jgi:ribonuclease P protein component